MLSDLLGSKNIEKILYFLLINEKCYGTQLHRLLNTPLTPIQKGLSKLEKAGVIQSVYEGKTRFYRFNPVYPLKKELSELLHKSYGFLPLEEKRKYYALENAFSQVPSLSYKQAQDTLLHCWSRLKSINALSISAHTQSDGQNRRGKGDVKVSEESPSIISFQETGGWQIEEDREMHFSNTLRWTLDLASGTIALEHLRFGAAKPVFLFHLKPKAQNLLVSVDSHLCGPDAYFGQVQIGAHFLQLSWKILGAKKNDKIESLYTSS